MMTAFARPARYAVPFFSLVFAAAAAHSQQLASGNPSDVIISQGGVSVTMQDIDAYAQKIPEGDRVGFFDNPKRIENVLMSLLLTKQLAAEARAQKIDQDALVQKELSQSEDDVLARADMEHFRKSLTPPSFENLAKEYYLAHKSEFVVPGTINVKHVLVSNKERSEAEAKARIAEVESAAKANPEQFDALIEKYSDDPSKGDNHGLMEDAGSSKYVPPFVEAAKALKKPGQISPPVKTQFGYHVLKLVEHKPDVQRAFAQVHDELIARLRTEYIDRQVADHQAQKRNQPVDANPDLVAAIRTRFLPPGAELPSEKAAEANAEKAKNNAAAEHRPDNGQH